MPHSPFITEPPRPIGLGAVVWGMTRRPVFLIITALLIVIAAPLLIGGIMLLRMALAESVHERLLAHGTRTDGQVVHVRINHNVNINDVNPRRITFRYSHAGQERTDSMQTLDVREADQLHTGDPVRVAYLDDEATLVDLEPMDFRIFYLVGLIPLSLFAVPVTVAALIMSGMLLKHGLNVRATLRDGMVRSATVLMITPASGLSVFGPSHVLRFVYGNEAGTAVEGSAKTADSELISHLQPGDAIHVLVRPGHPTADLILDRQVQNRLGA
ncbi:MAG: hypothetical protein JJU36_08900 [Phycisphaeraceae bacterium]|nr:hypothetical protein [Phycisphaeraceae bacterium]